MPVRPPSLRAIAAFEAAARHQSFSRAADELNLTQSAISHAIRALELRLGLSLFERFGRNVVLTEAGRAFVSRLRLSLELISDAFDTQKRAGRDAVVIGAPAVVLERMIAPRLPRLLAAEVADRVELRTRDAGHPGADVDVAVVFGLGASPGLARRRLAGESLIPVAAPSADLPRRPEDLALATLIAQPEHPWRLLLDPLGLGELPLTAGVCVDSDAMALELARSGAGVALVRSWLAADDLAARRLVRLFDVEAPMREDYSAVWNPASPRIEAIRAVIDWLAAELTPTDITRRAA